MSDLIGFGRRVVLVVAITSGLLTAVVAAGMSGPGSRPGPGGLLLIGTAVGVVVAAAGWVAFESGARRHRRAVAVLTAQVHALGEVPHHGGPAPVDLGDLSRLLEAQAGELTRSRAEAQGAAADASHQLRSPLTALQMRLEEISATDSLEVAHEEAAVSLAQVERLTEMVSVMLSRAKGDSRERPEISLDSVLAGLQREYQTAFRAGHRSMKVQGDRGLVVRAAPSDLSQIMQTLVENALQHGAGTVTIDATRRDSSVVVEVTDGGPGVPAAIAPHVFERSVTSDGSGLGLGVARQVAERNGGRLELVQATPAVFTLFLPGPQHR